MLACNSLAIESPAGSSGPVLIREPVDSWNKVVCRFLELT